MDEECQILFEDKEKNYNTMINRNTRKMNKNRKVKQKKHIKYLNKTLFKSKLEQTKLTYKYNEAKTFYQEVNSIRQGFKPQTLLIINEEGNTLSNNTGSPTKVV